MPCGREFWGYSIQPVELLRKELILCSFLCQCLFPVPRCCLPEVDRLAGNYPGRPEAPARQSGPGNPSHGWLDLHWPLPGIIFLCHIWGFMLSRCSAFIPVSSLPSFSSFSGQTHPPEPFSSPPTLTSGLGDPPVPELCQHKTKLSIGLYSVGSICMFSWVSLLPLRPHAWIALHGSVTPNPQHDAKPTVRGKPTRDGPGAGPEKEVGSLQSQREGQRQLEGDIWDNGMVAYDKFWNLSCSNLLKSASKIIANLFLCLVYILYYTIKNFKNTHNNSCT